MICHFSSPNEGLGVGKNLRAFGLATIFRLNASALQQAYRFIYGWIQGALDALFSYDGDHITAGN